MHFRFGKRFSCFWELFAWEDPFEGSEGSFCAFLLARLSGKGYLGGSISGLCEYNLRYYEIGKNYLTALKWRSSVLILFTSQIAHSTVLGVRLLDWLLR